MTAASITSKLAKTGYMESLTVIAFANTTGIGAVSEATAASGAPSAALTTTSPNSWVFAVGNDWDNPLARTPGPNQTIVSQVIDNAGDTYWVQSQTAITPLSGTSVIINDAAPTSDRWNLTEIEIL